MKKFRKMLFCALLFYPAWIFGGQVAGWQWPMPVLAGVLFLCGIWRNWRDPVFWTGAAFLALLGVQVWGAGAVSWLDAQGGVWIDVALANTYRMPFSVIRREALEILAWWFCVWVILLETRNGGFDKDSIVRGLVLNAGAVAVFGIVNRTAGADVYWVWPWKEHFAGFTYINNAGAFFYLALCCLFGVKADIRWKLALFALFVWSIVLIDSRWALLVMWFVGAVAGIRKLPRWRGWAWIALFLVGVVFVVMRWEWLLYSWEVRIWQVWAKLEVFRNFPAFGVGGWGARYFPSLYLTGNLAAWLSYEPITHCDAVQWLAEFGAVGFALILATGALCLWRRRGYGWPDVGVLLVLVHSFIDCPLRCPAVLFVCAFLIARRK